MAKERFESWTSIAFRPRMAISIKHLVKQRKMKTGQRRIPLRICFGIGSTYARGGGRDDLTSKLQKIRLESYI